jgi:hypothetical protein
VVAEPIHKVTDALSGEYSCTDSICAYYEPLTQNFSDMEITL